MPSPAAYRLTRIGRDDQGAGASHALDSITATLMNQKLAEALERGLKQFARADPDGTAPAHRAAPSARGSWASRLA